MIHWLWLVPFGIVAFTIGWEVSGYRTERARNHTYTAPGLDCGCPNDGRALSGCMRCDRWTCVPHSSRHPHTGEDPTPDV